MVNRWHTTYLSLFAAFARTPTSHNFSIRQALDPELHFGSQVRRAEYATSNETRVHTKITGLKTVTWRYTLASITLGRDSGEFRGTKLLG